LTLQSQRWTFGLKKGGQHCLLPQLDGEKTINSMIV